MSFDDLRTLVRQLPEIQAWPEMSEIVDRIGHRDSISVWEYPAAACAALGGRRDASLPGEAAIFCSLISIHLVDDMLDHDPAGMHHTLGAGRTANLALAFQAAAHKLIDSANVSHATRAALQKHVADLTLGTCIGQDMDSSSLVDEPMYWRVVHAKTPPLFSGALAIGALLAAGDEEVAAGLAGFGRNLGCFIQVSDDLSDAMKKPAGVDWSRPSNNLALLYATQVDHPSRDRFVELLTATSDPTALEEAQTLLLRSGAVSYCVFKMVEFWQGARRSLTGLPIVDPEPLQRLLSANLKPLRRLFAELGDELPADFELASE